MNLCQFALFLGFYFYVLNVNAANDAQRVILLSSFYGICWSKTSALAYSGLALHLGSSFDRNVPKTGKIVFEILDSWFAVNNRKVAMKSEMWSEKKISFTELTDRFVTRKTIFCFCLQKVIAPRTMAPLKICLRGQVFVHVETSTSHLAWSTNDSNLTDLLVMKTNLSKFCPECNPSLICS